MGKTWFERKDSAKSEEEDQQALHFKEVFRTNEGFPSR